uniref:DNA polymerase II small subunit n=1 Tax=uncultured marine thaumarchaeote AD1000_02_C08 TaxID=1455880 RepID=A0A075FH16_9ARCH|nr:DNA polymerase II small subunit (DPB2) [uncultured marine thaumarchaeote AD1000_02_C08]
METHYIVSFLLKKGFQVTPEAAESLRSMTRLEFQDLAKIIIKGKNRNNDDNFMISLDDVRNNTVKKSVEEETGVDDYEVLDGNDIMQKQLEGVDGYHLLMKNRFSKYKQIMFDRPDSRKVIRISTLVRNADSNEYKIAGLLKSKNKLEKAYEMELEDESTELKLLVIDGNNIRRLEGFLMDQMVVADVVFNNKIERFVVKNCHSLDIPTEVFPSVDGREPVYGVFLSDIHVGSKTFLEQEFQDFLDWINGRSGELDIVSRIKYIVIAGDVVDGIGVYPGQEDELTELNLAKQYDRFAQLMAQVPKSIKIFVSPGNHDATRQALPQPPIFKKYARSLYEMNNVVLLGDPCLVRLHGVNTLVYHGQSLVDIVGSSPGVTFDKPAEAMKVLLKARHLAPTHGPTRVALEENDKLVIKTVPNIFHCGHIHTVQALKYKGTLLVNSGTWQDQTQFQKRMGIVPNPAVAVIVDLNSLKVKMMKNFM